MSNSHNISWVLIIGQRLKFSIGNCNIYYWNFLIFNEIGPAHWEYIHWTQLAQLRFVHRNQRLAKQHAKHISHTVFWLLLSHFNRIKATGSMRKGNTVRSKWVWERITSMEEVAKNYNQTKWGSSMKEKCFCFLCESMS